MSKQEIMDKVESVIGEAIKKLTHNEICFTIATALEDRDFRLLTQEMFNQAVVSMNVHNELSRIERARFIRLFDRLKVDDIIDKDGNITVKDFYGIE